MAAMKLAPPARMTFEEFLKADFGGQRVEWVDGEVKYMGTVSDEHADLVGWLLALLRYLVDTTGAAKVRHEPFTMRLPSRPSGRNPDILVVLAEHFDRIRSNHVDGPADLVIEVVSPDDRSRDTVLKLVEYEQAGVPEYWILDPDRKEAVFLVLGNDGHYESIDPIDGIYRSTIMEGLWINVAWPFREPLPPVPEVLREWKLVP